MSFYWLTKLFGIKKRVSTKQVDWLSIESSWRLIEQMSKSNNQAQSKQAIIQADMLVDSIMKQAQIPGSNFADRIRAVRSYIEMPKYKKLWQAHIKRNELVHDQNSFVAPWELKTHLASFKEGIEALRRIR